MWRFRTFAFVLNRGVHTLSPAKEIGLVEQVKNVMFFLFVFET